MKISLFNSNAPTLINKFEGVLNKLLNGDTKGIDFNSLRTNLNTANDLASEAQKQLNSVNLAQLKALRTNAKAGSEFGIAVENAASLSHIVGVLTNMVNEVSPEEEKEASLDDILNPDDEEKDENCGSKNADESDDKDEDDSEDEADADDVMEKNSKNAGPDPIETGSEDGDQDTTGDEAAVAEGDDISNTLKNMRYVSKPAVKKLSNSNTNSGTLVPTDFLA